MFKKFVLPIALVIVLVFSACGNKVENTTSDSSLTEEDLDIDGMEAPSEVDPIETSDEESQEDTSEDVPEANPSENRMETLKKQLEELTLNEYPDLKMEAAILERMAILPGNSFRVTVKITNEGDKNVVYQIGSGRFTTPDSLYVNVEGLQTVIPEDHLGPVTMDMSYGILEPGKDVSFDYYVMAIKPSDDFDNNTYDFMNNQSLYIAEKSLPELLEFFPLLEAAEAGSYEGKAYFQYLVVEDSGDEENPDFGLGNPTAYAEAEFTVGVTA